MVRRVVPWVCGVVAVSALAVVSVAVTPATAPTTAKAPVDPWALPIVDKRTGKPDRAAVMAQLRDYSAAGMSRRLGPDYAYYHKETAKFPQVYLVPKKDRPGCSGKYQVGGPFTPDAGDFSSTQGQVLYVPEEGLGLDRVTIIEWSNNCFTEGPEPPWHGGFSPEPASNEWPKEKLGVPIGEARGMAAWSNCGVVVFSSGFVGTAGTCTAMGSNPTFKFPPNKVPTAVSVTNRNEMALVTVIDTDTNRGQVAVLLLESCSKNGYFAHEWPDAYPGLPNVAVFTGIKLLGYVDLPDIDFPTSVCAVGNHGFARVNGKNGNAGRLAEYDLSKAGDREPFFKGNNVDVVSTAGFAVVAGKYEGRATFIDLQPIFQKLREAYFTSDANFKKTRDLGPDPKQWPPTFEVEPKWKPVVVKTVIVPQPTTVIASLTGGAAARACVASMDGRAFLFSVGGLATDAPAKAAEIMPAGMVTLGKNPVCLAYQKGAQRSFMAVSRGDREVEWFDCGERDGKVTRRLRDERLLDPVCVEQSDTHGIEGGIITVADFAGRKILNYRFSQLVFATQGGAKFGMGADGKAEFECGGTMEFSGPPFVVSATNVN